MQAVVVVEPFDANEDARIEEALSIDAGRIARQREFSRRMVRARSGEETVGLIAFDRPMQKAFLFRARSASIARALFEHIERADDREGDVFQVVVEGDDALADALEAGGATRVESMLLMSGALPTDG